MRDTSQWHLNASSFAKNTYNPIRSIIETMEIVPNPDKHMIALSIGDPTVFGNLQPPQTAIEAVVDVVKKGKYNGYTSSTGHLEAREAVAKYCSTENHTLEAKDILLCSGCSSALDMCIGVLCSTGQTLLVPRPGFPLYGTLALGMGIKIKHYDLIPSKNWEVNIDHLESLIDETTGAMVINNPSNPCGSVFSKEHLQELVRLAEKYKVPIIADEIYDHFAFSGFSFHWLCSFSKEVPILSCGGLTKRFLVPGWRMGWIAVHDHARVMPAEVRQGLQSLSQRIIGSNTLVQGALPSILADTPQEFFEDTLNQVEANARLSFDLLSKTKGLKPILPQGAMYMMVHIDMPRFPAFSSDLAFVERMISEESVFCLPGKCFEIPNYVRVVLTVPEKEMKEACHRIALFCNRYFVPGKEETGKTFGVVSKANGVQNGLHSNGIPNGTPYTNGKTPHQSAEDIKLALKAKAVMERDIISAEMDGE